MSGHRNVAVFFHCFMVCLWMAIRFIICLFLYWLIIFSVTNNHMVWILTVTAKLPFWKALAFILLPTSMKVATSPTSLPSLEMTHLLSSSIVLVALMGLIYTSQVTGGVEERDDEVCNSCQFWSPGLQTQLCRVSAGGLRPVISPLSEIGVRSSLFLARLLSTKAITGVWQCPGSTWFLIWICHSLVK